DMAGTGPRGKYPSDLPTAFKWVGQSSCRTFSAPAWRISQADPGGKTLHGGSWPESSTCTRGMLGSPPANAAATAAAARSARATAFGSATAAALGAQCT